MPACHPSRLRRSAVSILSSVLALAIVSSSVVALAAPQDSAATTPGSDAATKEAAERFRKGVKLQDEGSLEAAIIEFERAYELAPNFRVLYNIAVVYRDKGDKAAALRAFERYLADGGSALDAKRRKDVESEIARARDVVAYVTIQSNVAGADVTIDDFPVGKTPIEKPLYLNVGRRKIELSKDGYKSESRIVTLAGGDKPTLEFSLQEIRREPPPVASTPAPVQQQPTPPPTQQPTPPPPPQDNASGQRTLGYSLGIVGIAGLGLGGAFGLMARSKWSDAKDSGCKEGDKGWTCPTSSAQNKSDSAKTQANVATLGFALGGTVLAAGILVLLTAPSAPEKTGKVQLVPQVGQDGGGVWLNGRF